MADDRLYIKVHNGMPDHPKIEPLSDAAFRLLVSLWCWCDRHDTDGKVSLPLWARRGTAKTRRELLDAPLAHLDTDHVQLHDYLEHQRSAAQKLAAKERAASAGRAGGLAKAKRTASESLSEPSSKNVAELEVELEKESSRPLDEPLRTDIERLCRRLADAVQQRTGRRPTITAKWRESARLLFDRDKRPVEEVIRVLDWSQADDFWQANVLSLPKFREKYDQLKLQMGRKTGQRMAVGSDLAEGDEEWMR